MGDRFFMCCCEVIPSWFDLVIPQGVLIRGGSSGQLVGHDQLPGSDGFNAWRTRSADAGRSDADPSPLTYDTGVLLTSLAARADAKQYSQPIFPDWPQTQQTETASWASIEGLLAHGPGQLWAVVQSPITSGGSRRMVAFFSDAGAFPAVAQDAGGVFGGVQDAEENGTISFDAPGATAFNGSAFAIYRERDYLGDPVGMAVLVGSDGVATQSLAIENATGWLTAGDGISGRTRAVTGTVIRSENDPFWGVGYRQWFEYAGAFATRNAGQQAAGQWLPVEYSTTPLPVAPTGLTGEGGVQSLHPHCLVALHSGFELSFHGWAWSYLPTFATPEFAFGYYPHYTYAITIDLAWGDHVGPGRACSATQTIRSVTRRGYWRTGGNLNPLTYTHYIDGVAQPIYNPSAAGITFITAEKTGAAAVCLYHYATDDSLTITSQDYAQSIDEEQIQPRQSPHRHDYFSGTYGPYLDGGTAEVHTSTGYKLWVDGVEQDAVLGFDPVGANPALLDLSSFGWHEIGDPLRNLATQPASEGGSRQVYSGGATALPVTYDSLSPAGLGVFHAGAGAIGGADWLLIQEWTTAGTSGGEPATAYKGADVILLSGLSVVAVYRRLLGRVIDEPGAAVIGMSTRWAYVTLDGELYALRRDGGGMFACAASGNPLRTVSEASRSAPPVSAVEPSITFGDPVWPADAGDEF